MTNDLISREVLKNWIKSYPVHERKATLIVTLIEAAPAVDAVPVVHSYWEPYGRNSNGTVGRWRCMNCKRTSLESGNFCPNCGAKMDKEEA